jgi:hypothetical protein
VEPPLEGSQPTKQVTVQGGAFSFLHHGGTETRRIVDCRLLNKSQPRTVSFNNRGIINYQQLMANVGNQQFSPLPSVSPW